LFKISNLALGGEAIVTALYSSVRDRERGRMIYIYIYIYIEREREREREDQ
jgi:hypothetical protein